MLKALELAGFKSFADRTRFEFPPGVSVIVGPNGSGKSNLVDAVKWVLGSQSAKSLRGQEMTDVIFNGCASRGPAGASEVTLTLDNDDGHLPLEAKEVHVTRRVYRSGEGEYLINRQPCRLRDIRDLLAGTGITTEAYCIIEQGKVDALLQSSPRDRRLIFEEAAGISQFKAKKATALRRLERVEQNLLRLSDIVDEVEGRLRSVRSQAGKARRYRECTERLQLLRTQVGMVDWQALTRQIDARESQLGQLKRHSSGLSAAVERSEKDGQDLERRLDDELTRLRGLEAAAAATREQIAVELSTISHQQARRDDSLRELAQSRRQLAALNARTEGPGESHRLVVDQLQAAERDLTAAQAEVAEAQMRACRTQQEVDQSRAREHALRAELDRQLRAKEQAGERALRLQTEFESAQCDERQDRAQLAELSTQRERLTAEFQRCAQAEAAVQSQASAHQRALRQAEQRLAHVRNEMTRADKHHRQLESRLARARERIDVLTELEQRLEGFDNGVQDLLRMAHDDATFDEAVGGVCGVVADLFHVDVDTAHLIETALGERTQFVVVASAARLLDSIQQGRLPTAGRIGFLRLDTRAAASALDHVDLSNESGVMGRADQFVEAAAEFAALVKRLLGRTWLVDHLATAQRLAVASGRGLDFVTSDGEMLTADGTIIVGPRAAALGIMSRRSELRACHEQVRALEAELAQWDATLSRLHTERHEQESLVASSVTAYSAIAEQLSDHRQQTVTAQTELERTVRDHERVADAVQARKDQLAALGAEIATAQDQLAACDQQAAQLQEQLGTCRHALASLEQHHATQQAEFVALQVAAAKCEQRVEMLRQQDELLRRNRQERDRTRIDVRQRLADVVAKLQAVDESLLIGRQAVAQLYLDKERFVALLAEQQTHSELLRRERTGISDRIREQRRQLATVHAQQHKLEAVLGRLVHDRQALCERMLDDYGVDLTQNGTAGSNDTGQLAGQIGNREAVEREIADLRAQVNAMGAVNMEALDELDQLETRFGTLSGQYRDLVDAKASLERIIHRINSDSRQLFQATLELVRGHFQELFRRMFGGGEADIVVDDSEDVLDCGIEIVARPPGKEACSISLLSGGEKTLTCVALLLAVFRSKPSPFCLLDEVDAALDEANIGRFTAVLREFLSSTQFVVVTHSKRTMSGADTLYGVTMEESGVSKRVSVRFEDVGEDGQIQPDRLAQRRESLAVGAAASSDAGPMPVRRAA